VWEEEEGLELFRESASEEEGVCGGGCIFAASNWSPGEAVGGPCLSRVSPLLAWSGAFGGGWETIGGRLGGGVSLPEPLLLAFDMGKPIEARGPMEAFCLPEGREGKELPSLPFSTLSLFLRSLWRLEAKKEEVRSMLRPDLGSTMTCSRGESRRGTMFEMDSRYHSI